MSYLKAIEKTKKDKEKDVNRDDKKMIDGLFTKFPIGQKEFSFSASAEVSSFIDGMCIRSPNIVTLSAMYESYRDWCRTQKYLAVGKGQFGKAMQRHGYVQERDRKKRYWEGVSCIYKPTVDVVNSPPHYNQYSIECIDAIQAATTDGFEFYLQGNILKYLWRYKYKNGIEDLNKAQWYLNKLIETTNGNSN